MILEGCDSVHWYNSQLEQYVRRLCRKMSANYVPICVGKHTFPERLAYIRY